MEIIIAAESCRKYQAVGSVENRIEQESFPAQMKLKTCRKNLENRKYLFLSRMFVMYFSQKIMVKRATHGMLSR